MKYKCFKYNLKDHIAHVILSRGDELNTMIKEFWSELPNLVDEISNEGQARVILISAEGKHFTAGMDLENFTDSELTEKNKHQGLQNEAIYRLTKDLQYSFSSLEKSRIPVIVAINGACVGGGVDMISACDIRYATKDAFFLLSRDKFRASRRCRHTSKITEAHPRRHCQKISPHRAKTWSR
jgi:Enoyl-CoA hydratase/carnithine racemase